MHKTFQRQLICLLFSVIFYLGISQIVCGEPQSRLNHGFDVFDMQMGVNTDYRLIIYFKLIWIYFHFGQTILAHTVLLLCQCFSLLNWFNSVPFIKAQLETRDEYCGFSSRHRCCASLERVQIIFLEHWFRISHFSLSLFVELETNKLHFFHLKIPTIHALSSFNCQIFFPLWKMLEIKHNSILVG